MRLADYGIVLIVLGVVVAIAGPHLGEGGKTHHWYLWGGASLLVGGLLVCFG